MAQQVREIMTTAPVSVEPGTSVAQVARRMRDEDIGAVLVAEGEQVRGLVTDRDPESALGDISSTKGNR